MKVRDLEKIIGINRVDLDRYQENILSYTQLGQIELFF